MNIRMEYKFKTDAEAWEFAHERDVNSVSERHYKSGRVEYVVYINRKEK